MHAVASHVAKMGLGPSTLEGCILDTCTLAYLVLGHGNRKKVQAYWYAHEVYTA